MDLIECLPIVLPARWARHQPPQQLIDICGRNNCAGFISHSGVKVFISIDELDDGVGTWLHMSVSRLGRIPNWDELKEAKELFFGDQIAIQLLPPKAHWINISECLHLFTRLDGDTVPPGLWKTHD